MLIMEDQGAPDMRRFYLGHAQISRATRAPCRCLFGPADPADTQRFIQEEMKQIYEGQKKKWNFDFEREVPLPGRYQWEPVGCAPPEQSRTEAGFGPTSARPSNSKRADVVIRESSPERSEQFPAAPAAPAASSALVTAASVSRNDAEAAPQPAQRQSQITEFLRTRKRPAPESKSEASSPEAVPSPKRAASEEEGAAFGPSADCL